MGLITWLLGAQDKPNPVDAKLDKVKKAIGTLNELTPELEQDGLTVKLYVQNGVIVYDASISVFTAKIGKEKPKPKEQKK